jgi:hyaluronoglucosaminidase
VSDGLARARLWADAGDEAGAAQQLRNLASQLLPAADHLLRGPVANPALIEECRPWLVAFEMGARTIGRMADLAAEGRLLRDARELIPDQIRLRRARVRVFGDALEMTLSDLTGLMFRPGEVPQLEGEDP